MYTEKVLNIGQVANNKASVDFVISTVRSAEEQKLIGSIGEEDRPKLSACTKKYYAYLAEAPLQTLGEFETNLSYAENSTQAKVIVVKARHERLISWEASPVRNTAYLRLKAAKQGHKENWVCYANNRGPHISIKAVISNLLKIGYQKSIQPTADS
ncbi:hypothetical protein BpHYR1_004508 [Brachionus plicatilis]|uniref:Uncharacterized protein n=1 Tax=Brachionus plicatilis TaxID=10195 RepID=A0A3M7SJ62_BRAPC|nr:hypothetical protein BpHYR1_004508 [Brachionus plicatilis]